MIDDVIAYYHIQNVQLPDDLKDMQEAMALILSESGMMRRSVTLTGRGTSHATGAMLGWFADGTPRVSAPACTGMPTRIRKPAGKQG